MDKIRPQRLTLNLMALWQVLALLFLVACEIEKKGEEIAVAVTAVSPATVPLEGGTTIVLTGTDLKYVTNVLIDGVACTTLVLGEEISCVTPSHDVGAATISLYVPKESPTTATLTYVYPDLAVTSFTPTSADVAGGSQITFRGTGFTADVTVTIGGVSCTPVTFDSLNSIRCPSPALSAGLHTVVVSNASGDTLTLTQKFTASVTPTVSSVAPTSGTAGGGTVLTITGTDFYRPFVSVGYVPCAISSWTTTSITCTTGARSAGVVNVRVQNNDGNGVTLSNQYTYIQNPVPTSITPALGSKAGGTTVVLRGSAFVNGATVAIGGASCTPVTFTNSTQISCVTGAIATAGTYDVVVTNPNTLTGTLSGGFLYREPAPTLTSISPTAGALAGGATLTLTGTGFITGATVKVGGVTCTSPVVGSSTSATCTLPAGAAGVVDVVLTNPDGQAVTLSSSFTYQAAPTITSVVLPGGPLAGGTTVDINGTNFLAGLTVTVGGNPCTAQTLVSSILVQCTVDAHAAGAVDVVVTNFDNQSATLTNGFIYANAPTVTSLSPTGGPTGGGADLVITGTGFQSGAVASVNGVDCATTTFTSATSVTCSTPAGALGTVGVTVTNPDSQSGSLAASYTYQVPPSIVSVSPAAGSTAGGNAITITGTDFLTPTQVKIGSTLCPVTAENATTITCTVPAQAAGSYTLYVYNNDNQSASILNGYTYLVAPTITGVSPNGGDVAGGTSITLTGTNFFSGATVDFGGSACGTVSVTDSTTLTCTTSAHAAGAVSVTVTNIDAQFGVGANIFTYQVPPTVTSLTPAAGALAGGTAVTVNGSDFLTGATVTIDGVACATPVVTSPTTITCTTAAHAAGAVAVVVTNPDSQTGTLAGGFTYQPAPTITSFSPSAASSVGGTSITITGTDFDGAPTVKIDGVDCPVTASTATTVTCTAAAHATGLVTMVVTNSDAQVSNTSSSLLYLAAPTITSLDVTAGALAGGTTVTISGTDFFTGVAVDFGGSACTVVSQTSTSISCTTSAHAAGAVAVTVTNVDGQSASSAGAYTYQAAPTVTSVAYNAGAIGGSTAVTVNGTGFLVGASVKFDTATCVVTAITATAIDCLTPAHAAGTVSVTVTNADTQSGTLASAYTYQAAPTVLSISPAYGNSAGGTSVTITGAGFLAGTSVMIGGNNCAVTAETSTTITCTTTAGSAGASDVQVTNNDSQFGTKTGAFTYLDAPTVASISPVAGSVNGGATVTITGTNFYTGASVSLGGSSCTVLTLTSTTITCRTNAHAAASVAVDVTNVDAQTTSGSAYEYRPAPTVTSVSPSIGPVAGGTSITVTGTGFVAGATVTVGSSDCTVSATTATSITCTTTLSLVSGSVAVKVTNPDDLQQGSKSTAFIYLMAPTITSVSPAIGALAGGTTITLTGTNFYPGAQVQLDGVDCTAESVNSDTSMTCVTPAHVAGTIDVSVANPDAQSATKVGAFTYQGPPTITGISPGSGRLAGGTAVSISGTNFFSGASVKIGGNTCTSLTVVSSTSISCTTPPGVGGTADVMVTNADGQTDTSLGLYTYQAGPTVTTVSPSGGPLAGGTTITITGTNFLTGATVKIGATDCTGISVDSVTQITCTTPAKSAGAYTVTVTNTDNQAGSKTSGFTYQGAPTVGSISPAVGASAGGTLVTITGTNFLSGATVTVAGTACTSVNVASATTLTCLTGAHAAGSGVIAVTNADGQSGSGSSYLYQDAPAVISVSPTTTSLAGGGVLTVTGAGFLTGATVKVGTTTCSSPTVVSANTVTCTLPALSAGAKDVVVTNTDTQAGTLSSAITYQGAPTVSSVSPVMGDVGGGQVLTVSGTSFLAGATVSIGGTACAVSAVTSTSITCTTGAKVAGNYSVVVTNSDAQSGTKANAYSYVDAPTVTAISPTSGGIAGGTTVTITGTNFFSGSTVDIGGSACTSVTILSTTSLTCVTAAVPAGTVDVNVISPFSTTGTLSNGYTYTSTPATLVFMTGTSSPTPPNPDNYGSTTTNITHTFTLKNTGAVATTAITVSLGGSTPVAWAIGTDNCSTFTLAAGASCTVQVTFLGAFLSSGSYSATVVGSATTGGTTTNTIQGSRP